MGLARRRALRRVLVKSVLLTVVLVFTSQPLLVAAQPLPESPPDPIRALTESGDAYISSMGRAMASGAELITRVEGINAAPLESLSEAPLEQARGVALDMAREASIALGVVDELASSIQSVSGEYPEALDVLQAAEAGLPDEMRNDLLIEAGLSPGQVADLESELEGTARQRIGISTDGLPAAYREQLSSAGFTEDEISRITQSIGSRGLADQGLDTTLAQFRASQDELASARTHALIAYVQLLGKQIAVRQSQGVPPRAVNDDELEELAADELRLLVHAAHLQELWGDDPRLDVGEGDWWFIERYATRAAERLEALTLDSQNRGLVAELLIMLHFANLGASARAGDPAYVKAELDGLAQLLAAEIGEASFLSDQRAQTVGPLKAMARIVSAPQVREIIQWPVGDHVRTRVAAYSRDRLQSEPLSAFAAQVGAFEEADESNNRMAYLFAAGLPYYDQLEADLLLTALDIIAFVNDGSMLAWIEAILTGETDKPGLMVASVAFSLIPVIGVLPDLYTLAADPSVFVKALSIVGVVGSLGDLLALIGLEPVAGASFLGDAASAVMKSLFRYADEAAQIVLNGLKLDEAFRVILDVVGMAVKFAGDTLGGSLDEVIGLLDEILAGGLKLWDDFIAFVAGIGRPKLVELGFDEGGQLAGRALRLSEDLAARISDEAIDALTRIGRNLPEYGLRLADMSDEAVIGLGKVVDDVGEAGLIRLLDDIQGTGSDVVHSTLHILGDAGYGVGWTDEALEGVGNVVRKWSTEVPSLGPAKVDGLIRAVDDPDLINKTFHVLKEINTAWSDEAMEGVAVLIAATPGQDLSRVFNVLDGTSRSTVGEAFFRRIKVVSEAEIEGWSTFALQMSGSQSAARGAFHVLDFVEEIGVENVARLEQAVTREVADQTVTRVYDVVSGLQRFELKNVASFTSDSASQLARDLKLLTPEELENLVWVFRGPENGEIVDRFTAVIKREAPDLYDRGIFTESNLVFFRDTRPF